MTVLQLIFHLVRGIIAGKFRPGDIVAREWGEWDQDGRDVVKAIYFTGRRKLKEIPPSHPDEDSLDHRMFGHHGTGGESRVVVLD